METDWSAELAAEDPALELPWAGDDGTLRWVNLREHPEQIEQISECADFPELIAPLRALNAAESPFATAKCDVFAAEPTEEADEIFGAWRQTGYIDLLFAECFERESTARNFDFAAHEQFASAFAGQAEVADPEASAELIIRRCYYHPESMQLPGRTVDAPGRGNAPSQKRGARLEELIVSGRPAVAGFYFTLYVTGYGDDEAEAREQWRRALAACAELLAPISASGQASAH